MDYPPSALQTGLDVPSTTASDVAAVQRVQPMMARQMTQLKRLAELPLARPPVVPGTRQQGPCV